jgi:hypothetical protein
MSLAAPFDRDRDGDRLVARARQLRAEGLSRRAVAGRLAAETGVRPSLGTVTNWTLRDVRPLARHAELPSPERRSAAAAEIRLAAAPPGFRARPPSPGPDERHLLVSSRAYRRLVRALARGGTGA